MIGGVCLEQIPVLVGIGLIPNLRLIDRQGVGWMLLDVFVQQVVSSTQFSSATRRAFIENVVMDVFFQRGKCGCASSNRPSRFSCAASVNAVDCPISMGSVHVCFGADVFQLMDVGSAIQFFSEFP